MVILYGMVWLGIGYYRVAEPEAVEPKLFGDLEPEPKINLDKHFLLPV